MVSRGNKNRHLNRRRHFHDHNETNGIEKFRKSQGNNRNRKRQSTNNSSSQKKKMYLNKDHGPKSSNPKKKQKLTKKQLTHLADIGGHGYLPEHKS